MVEVSCVDNLSVIELYHVSSLSSCVRAGLETLSLTVEHDHSDCLPRYISLSPRKYFRNLSVFFESFKIR